MNRYNPIRHLSYLLIHIIAGISILFTDIRSVYADEGMYPLSEIYKLNLRKKGLKISAENIFNTGHTGLIDAIVNIGGCTGSFVSPDGLIITNHHCAFGAVQQISTKENDYITDGFLAKTREEEVSARGFTVRIVDSYRDVSDEVLVAVNDTMDPADRTRAIDKKIKEIVTDIEKQNPGKRADIAEMFAGKSYMLFIYTHIRDVRAVYIPPRSIGEFGGENDNWIWPRHTGDFAFIRAYVAPDGTPAEYSAKNVPYRPVKFLKVAADGVDENDPVFILGYPGRTYRHRTASYLAFEERIRMPYVADLYELEIDALEKMCKDDRSVAIKLDGRIKGLANTMKNYRGKLSGMKKTLLVDKKIEEEKMLQEFIRSDPGRLKSYGTLLKEIENIYSDMSEKADYELVLSYLRQSSTLLNSAYTIYEAAVELKKPDVERASQYMDRNFSRTKESLQMSLKDYHEPADRLFLREMLMRAAALPPARRIPAVDEIIGNDNPGAAIDRFLEKAFKESRLNDGQTLADLLTKSHEDIQNINDPFLKFAGALYPAYEQLKTTRQQREGALSKLSALFVDVKQDYLKKDFIPDANGTLRLTFGKIEGYSPADALYAAPITTVKGVIEKTTGEEPYITPQKLIDMHAKKNFGRYMHKKLKSVPVALLYNLDTTGGNSGSPLLNKYGEIVGVNFDRTYEATINDYAWNENYSRSIAVDIRYVLWVTEMLAGAGHLLREMGVPDRK